MGTGDTGRGNKGVLRKLLKGADILAYDLWLLRSSAFRTRGSWGLEIQTLVVWFFKPLRSCQNPVSSAVLSEGHKAIERTCLSAPRGFAPDFSQPTSQTVVKLALGGVGRNPHWVLGTCHRVEGALVDKPGYCTPGANRASRESELKREASLSPHLSPSEEGRGSGRFSPTQGALTA